MKLKNNFIDCFHNTFIVSPVWECLLPSSAWRVNEQNKFIFAPITLKHQAELEGRHFQARALN
jgi:hypothetical protein